MSLYSNTLKQLGFKDSTFQQKTKGRISSLSSISRQLFKAHYDGYHPRMSRQLATALKRYINTRPKHERKSPEFVAEIRRKILCLHEYNLQIAKVKFKYPRSEQLDAVLVQYVELECEVLYDSYKEVDKEYENYVTQKVLRLLRVIVHDAVQNSEVPLKATIQACDKALLKLFASVRADCVSENNLVANTIIKLLHKLSLLEEVNKLKGKNVSFQQDTFLRDPLVCTIRESLATSDYESEIDDDDDDTVTIFDDPFSYSTQRSQLFLPHGEEKTFAQASRNYGLEENFSSYLNQDLFNPFQLKSKTSQNDNLRIQSTNLKSSKNLMTEEPQNKPFLNHMKNFQEKTVNFLPNDCEAQTQNNLDKSVFNKTSHPELNKHNSGSVKFSQHLDAMDTEEFFSVNAKTERSNFSKNGKDETVKTDIQRYEEIKTSEIMHKHEKPVDSQARPNDVQEEFGNLTKFVEAADSQARPNDIQEEFENLTKFVETAVNNTNPNFSESQISEVVEIIEDLCELETANENTARKASLNSVSTDMEALPNNSIPRKSLVTQNVNGGIITIEILDDDDSNYNENEIQSNFNLESTEIKLEENEENHSPNFPVPNSGSNNQNFFTSDKGSNNSSSNGFSKLEKNSNNEAKDAEASSIVISDSEDEPLDGYEKDNSNDVLRASEETQVPLTNERATDSSITNETEINCHTEENKNEEQEEVSCYKGSSISLSPDTTERNETPTEETNVDKDTGFEVTQEVNELPIGEDMISDVTEETTQNVNLLSPMDVEVNDHSVEETDRNVADKEVDLTRENSLFQNECVESGPTKEQVIRETDSEPIEKELEEVYDDAKKNQPNENFKAVDENQAPVKEKEILHEDLSVTMAVEPVPICEESDTIATCVSETEIVIENVEPSIDELHSTELVISEPFESAISGDEHQKDEESEIHEPCEPQVDEKDIVSESTSEIVEPLDEMLEMPVATPMCESSEEDNCTPKDSVCQTEIEQTVESVQAEKTLEVLEEPVRCESANHIAEEEPQNELQNYSTVEENQTEEIVEITAEECIISADKICLINDELPNIAAEVVCHEALESVQEMTCDAIYSVTPQYVIQEQSDIAYSNEAPQIKNQVQVLQHDVYGPDSQEHTIINPNTETNVIDPEVPQETISQEIEIKSVPESLPLYSLSSTIGEVEYGEYSEQKKVGDLELLANIAADQETLAVKTDSEKEIFDTASDVDSTTKLNVPQSTPKRRKSKVKFESKKKVLTRETLPRAVKQFQKRHHLKQEAENKRVTRNMGNKSKVLRETQKPPRIKNEDSKYTPHDFISLENSILPPRTNNVYAQKRLMDTNTTSEDSNDSCESTLFIDLGENLKNVDKTIKSVYEEDTICDMLEFITTENKSAVCISIPENEDCASDSFHILKQMEDFVDNNNVEKKSVEETSAPLEEIDKNIENPISGDNNEPVLPTDTNVEIHQDSANTEESVTSPQHPEENMELKSVKTTDHSIDNILNKTPPNGEVKLTIQTCQSETETEKDCTSLTEKEVKEPDVQTENLSHKSEIQDIHRQDPLTPEKSKLFEALELISPEKLEVLEAKNKVEEKPCEQQENAEMQLKTVSVTTATNDDGYVKTFKSKGAMKLYEDKLHPNPYVLLQNFDGNNKIELGMRTRLRSKSSEQIKQHGAGSDRSRSSSVDFNSLSASTDSSRNKSSDFSELDESYTDSTNAKQMIDEQTTNVDVNVDQVQDLSCKAVVTDNHVGEECEVPKITEEVNSAPTKDTIDCMEDSLKNKQLVHGQEMEAEVECHEVSAMTDFPVVEEVTIMSCIEDVVIPEVTITEVTVSTEPEQVIEDQNLIEKELDPITIATKSSSSKTEVTVSTEPEEPIEDHNVVIEKELHPISIATKSSSSKTEVTVSTEPEEFTEDQNVVIEKKLDPISIATKSSSSKKRSDKNNAEKIAKHAKPAGRSLENTIKKMKEKIEESEKAKKEHTSSQSSSDTESKTNSPEKNISQQTDAVQVLKDKNDTEKKHHKKVHPEESIESNKKDDGHKRRRSRSSSKSQNLDKKPEQVTNKISPSRSASKSRSSDKRSKHHSDSENDRKRRSKSKSVDDKEKIGSSQAEPNGHRKRRSRSTSKSKSLDGKSKNSSSKHKTEPKEKSSHDDKKDHHKKRSSKSPPKSKPRDVKEKQNHHSDRRKDRTKDKSESKSKTKIDENCIPQIAVDNADKPEIEHKTSRSKGKRQKENNSKKADGQEDKVDKTNGKHSKKADVQEEKVDNKANVKHSKKANVEEEVDNKTKKAEVQEEKVDYKTKDKHLKKADILEEKAENKTNDKHSKKADVQEEKFDNKTNVKHSKKADVEEEVDNKTKKADVQEEKVDYKTKDKHSKKADVLEEKADNKTNDKNSKKADVQEEKFDNKTNVKHLKKADVEEEVDNKTKKADVQEEKVDYKTKDKHSKKADVLEEKADNKTNDKNSKKADVQEEKFDKTNDKHSKKADVQEEKVGNKTNDKHSKKADVLEEIADNKTNDKHLKKTDVQKEKADNKTNDKHSKKVDVQEEKLGNKTSDKVESQKSKSHNSIKADDIIHKVSEKDKHRDSHRKKEKVQEVQPKTTHDNEWHKKEEIKSGDKSRRSHSKEKTKLDSVSRSKASSKEKSKEGNKKSERLEEPKETESGKHKAKENEKTSTEQQKQKNPESEKKSNHLIEENGADLDASKRSFSKREISLKTSVDLGSEAINSNDKPKITKIEIPKKRKYDFDVPTVSIEISYVVPPSKISKTDEGITKKSENVHPITSNRISSEMSNKLPQLKIPKIKKGKITKNIENITEEPLQLTVQEKIANHSEDLGVTILEDEVKIPEISGSKERITPEMKDASEVIEKEVSPLISEDSLEISTTNVSYDNLNTAINMSSDAVPSVVEETDKINIVTPEDEDKRNDEKAQEAPEINKNGTINTYHEAQPTEAEIKKKIETTSPMLLQNEIDPEPVFVNTVFSTSGTLGVRLLATSIDSTVKHLPAPEADISLIPNISTSVTTFGASTTTVSMSCGVPRPVTIENASCSTRSVQEKTCLFSFNEDGESVNRENLNTSEIFHTSLGLEDISPTKLPLASNQSLDFISPSTSIAEISNSMNLVRSLGTSAINFDVPDTSEIDIQQSNKRSAFGSNFVTRVTEISCFVEKESTADHNYTLGDPLLGGNNEDKNILTTGLSLSNSPEEFQLNESHLEDLSFNENNFIEENGTLEELGLLLPCKKEKPDFDNIIDDAIPKPEDIQNSIKRLNMLVDISQGGQPKTISVDNTIDHGSNTDCSVSLGIDYAVSKLLFLGGGEVTSQNNSYPTIPDIDNINIIESNVSMHPPKQTLDDLTTDGNRDESTVLPPVCYPNFIASDVNQKVVVEPVEQCSITALDQLKKDYIDISCKTKTKNKTDKQSVHRPSKFATFLESVKRDANKNESSKAKDEIENYTVRRHNRTPVFPPKKRNATQQHHTKSPPESKKNDVLSFDTDTDDKSQNSPEIGKESRIRVKTDLIKPADSKGQPSLSSLEYINEHDQNIASEVVLPFSKPSPSDVQEKKAPDAAPKSDSANAKHARFDKLGNDYIMENILNVRSESKLQKSPSEKPTKKADVADVTKKRKVTSNDNEAKRDDKRPRKSDDEGEKVKDHPKSHTKKSDSSKASALSNDDIFDKLLREGPVNKVFTQRITEQPKKESQSNNSDVKSRGHSNVPVTHKKDRNLQVQSTSSQPHDSSRYRDGRHQRKAGYYTSNNSAQVDRRHAEKRHISVPIVDASPKRFIKNSSNSYSSKSDPCTTREYKSRDRRMSTEQPNLFPNSSKPEPSRQEDDKYSWIDKFSGTGLFDTPSDLFMAPGSKQEDASSRK